MFHVCYKKSINCDEPLLMLEKSFNYMENVFEYFNFEFDPGTEIRVWNTETDKLHFNGIKITKSRWIGYYPD